MTRDSLRPLEGGLVVFNGRLADAGPARDNCRDYLLTSVRLWQWDGNSPIPFDEAPNCALDHAWIRLPSGDCSVELLTRAEGVAQIRWYTRADGSTDLGLTVQQSLNLDAVMDGLNRSRKQLSRPRLIATINELLSSCGRPGHYSYSQWLQANEALRRTQALRDRLVRSQQREDQIKASAPRALKARSAKCFADLLKTA